LLAVLSIAVLLTLVGIGTYALFSDSASSTGNQFQAGTMNLQVNGAEQLTTFNFSNVSPGWSHTETYTVSNVGNVQGRATFDATSLVSTGGVLTSAEQVVDPGNAGNLSAATHVVATVDGATAYDGTLAGFVAGGAQDLGIVAGGGSETVVVTFSIDPSTGNEIQGDGVNFNLGFTLTSVPLG
jgi:spore coat-associated protein N